MYTSHSHFQREVKKKIYYLHGALHLYEEHGSIKKLSSSKSNVLLEHMVNNMGQGLMPIFVSEGNWELKKKAIESNPYLKFCYDKLRSTEGDLTIFGHSLNKDTDYHIIDAIKKNKYISNIAYGIFTSGKEDLEIEHEKTSVNLAFQGKKSIHFFDSSSIFYYVSNWKGFGKPPWEV
ncbi:DUF4917 family protein [Paenibacillus thiaminolyticus]|uniref:DUF4917 family protein n=1 Tax=Paenibacillus thiaminolyticus TaxID=49283 RepID=UPI00116593B5|nr:DUF4917 family protein [Paenibacillus thiaminolyticus]